ncbi:MAG: arylsulfatase [Bacteroides sp.]
MKKKHLLVSVLWASSLQAVWATQPPHIVLIMCDDMGFSDLGCYGGEVRTPHIDYLAENGLRFSQFKNAGRSCPSRASLLTGRYQHGVGMGWMTAVDEHRPGYRGELSSNYPTVAEVLKANGYHTYMSGKWHVTLDDAFSKPNGSYPTERGFDKYYGCLSGGGSYYTPKPLYSSTTPITNLPDDYYYTTAITDSAVSFIHAHQASTPMFMYVAHYAPHRPLQAPKERVDACKERYRVGYDRLREQRFKHLQEAGFIGSGQTLPVYQKEFGGKRPLWVDLTPEQQERWVTEMATFAAMIEVMDDGIGEIIQAIKEKGMLDNTLFLFLSDNGATNEGDLTTQLAADLSNTPYRSYKQWCFQGGTSAPLIVASGGDRFNLRKGEICHDLTHIIDIPVTCLELASVAYPQQFRGHNVSFPDGKSIFPLLNGGKIASRELYFEHQTSCAIISNGWKLVRNNGKQPWELINLLTDPFETNDLSAQYPRKVKALEKKWNRWAKQQSVFPFEYRPWGKRIQYYKQINP